MLHLEEDGWHIHTHTCTHTFPDPLASFADKTHIALQAEAFSRVCHRKDQTLLVCWFLLEPCQSSPTTGAKEQGFRISQGMMLEYGGHPKLRSAVMYSGYEPHRLARVKGQQGLGLKAMVMPPAPQGFFTMDCWPRMKPVLVMWSPPKVMNLS